MKNLLLTLVIMTSLAPFDRATEFCGRTLNLSQVTDWGASIPRECIRNMHSFFKKAEEMRQKENAEYEKKDGAI